MIRWRPHVECAWWGGGDPEVSGVSLFVVWLGLAFEIAIGREVER